MQQKFIGVAITLDLDDLAVQSRELSEYVRDLKKQLSSQTITISKLISDITHIQADENRYRHQIDFELNGIRDFDYKLSQRITNETEKINEEVNVNTRSIFDLYTLTRLQYVK